MPGMYFLKVFASCEPLNCFLQVGKIGGSPIAVATDPSPLAVKYVAFSTKSGSNAEWRFHDDLCRGYRKYSIPFRSNQKCIYYSIV